MNVLILGSGSWGKAIASVITSPRTPRINTQEINIQANKEQAVRIPRDVHVTIWSRSCGKHSLARQGSEDKGSVSDDISYTDDINHAQVCEIIFVVVPVI